MKMLKPILLSAVVAICSLVFAVSATDKQNENKQDTTTVFTCDTTKCRAQASCSGKAQNCTQLKSMKCGNAGSSACRDMRRANGCCSGASFKKCQK